MNFFLRYLYIWIKPEVTKHVYLILNDGLLMKVNSTIYKGIEYIQVRELPPDQQELLLKTINRDLLIKIMIDGKLVGNCLQFKDYEIWFDSVYQDKRNPSKSSSASREKTEAPIVKVGALKKK